MVYNNVLVTGGFGNVGSRVVDALLVKGDKNITVFDKKGPLSEYAYPRYADKVTVIWGDICNKKDLEKALRGIDAVVHIAAIIPPLSESNTQLSWAVNVDGTTNLIEIMERDGMPKRIVFASSTAVHGFVPGRRPPLTPETEYHPNDTYGEQKIANEKALMASGLDWTICRMAATPPVDLKHSAGGKKNMEVVFGMPADCRVEVMHPADAGLAFANAVDCGEAISKRLFLGGGKEMQMTGYDFVNAMLRGVGVGRISREAFSRNPTGAHVDFCNTEESQRLLNYQNHTMEDYIAELRKNTGVRYYLTRLFSPLVRYVMTRRSPYYKKS